MSETEPKVTVTVTVERTGCRNKAEFPLEGSSGTAMIEGAEMLPIPVKWKIQDYNNPRSHPNWGFDEFGDEEDSLTHHRIRTDPSGKRLGKNLFRTVKRAIWHKLRQDPVYVEAQQEWEAYLEQREREREEQQ